MSTNGRDVNPKKLTPEELKEVRNSWGFGVPLGMLAKPHGITEQELRQQLGVATSRAIPEPPVQHRGLIGPNEVAQMADRKRQLQTLIEWSASREKPEVQS